MNRLTLVMDEDTASNFGTPEMMNKEDSKPKEKEIPRYLRASTGSCHDFCKYGRKTIPVEKPWRSTAKKIFKKASDAELNGASKLASSRTNKVMEVKKKKVCDEIIKRELGKSLSGLKKQEDPWIISPADKTPVKQMKKKTLCSKLEASPDSGSLSSGKQKVLTKSYSALATSKSKVNHGHLASSSSSAPGSKSRGKDEDAEINKARVTSKKVPVIPRSSLRKSQSLKAASASYRKPRHLNRTDESNKELDGYPVEEKTLHVVEMETTNKVISEGDQNQQCVVDPFPPTLSTQIEDECTVSEEEEYEYPSGSNGTESAEEEIGTSDGEKKQRARKEGDSLDEAAHKLHFRRGKVVDADNMGESARKLKFRRGKGLREDKAEDAQGRRSFMKIEDSRVEGEEEEEEEEEEKVVLRHQDVQEKDAQGLLNNVIEETASKLVEARKSKVKALVGAFETVISLQESKPPANSGT